MPRLREKRHRPSATPAFSSGHPFNQIRRAEG